MGCMTLRQMSRWEKGPELCDRGAACPTLLGAPTPRTAPSHSWPVPLSILRGGHYPVPTWRFRNLWFVSTRDCGRGRDHLSVPGLRHAELHGQRPRQVSRPQFFFFQARRRGAWTVRGKARSFQIERTSRRRAAQREESPRCVAFRVGLSSLSPVPGHAEGRSGCCWSVSHVVRKGSLPSGRNLRMSRALLLGTFLCTHHAKL